VATRIDRPETADLWAEFEQRIIDKATTIATLKSIDYMTFILNNNNNNDNDDDDDDDDKRVAKTTVGLCQDRKTGFELDTSEKIIVPIETLFV